MAGSGVTEESEHNRSVAVTPARPRFYERTFNSPQQVGVMDGKMLQRRTPSSEVFQIWFARDVTKEAFSPRFADESQAEDSRLSALKNHSSFSPPKDKYIMAATKLGGFRGLRTYKNPKIVRNRELEEAKNSHYKGLAAPRVS
ncbi:hypothetical protein J6590_079443 [Homalodisca vitripennis]|nr:hypothetical protein J6590_079443 [Homalodisca vitripennis]